MQVEFATFTFLQSKMPSDLEKQTKTSGLCNDLLMKRRTVFDYLAFRDTKIQEAEDA